MKTILILIACTLFSAAAFAQMGDFGDAPHCYPSTLAQNGARHAVSALMLGPAKNDEPDGRPHPLSQFPAEEPTDDGVLLPASLQAGQGISARVTASAPVRLDAWVDWNHDGDWNDPDEQIFTSTPVAAGLNTLTFGAPSHASGGTSIARFRLSLAGGLAPTGPAPEGEVEDYRVIIAAAPESQPVTDPLAQHALTSAVQGVPGSETAIWTFSWLGDPGHFTELEVSGTFSQWTGFARPAGAPPTTQMQSRIIDAYNCPLLIRERAFIRLVRHPLRTQAVPCFPGVHERLSFVSGGVTRTFTLVIPPGYVPGMSLPLVFVLHGGGQTSASFAALHSQELYPAAAAQAMVLCLPDGTHSTTGEQGWSSSDDDGDPLTPWIDDVAYLDNLTAAIEAALGTNPARRYFAGFSAGGVMTHFMTARSTRPIAAIAACGSAIGSPRGRNQPVTIIPPALAPVPVMIINLADDAARPFLGIPPPAERQAASVAQAIEHWVAQNGLGAAPHKR